MIGIVTCSVHGHLTNIKVAKSAPVLVCVYIGSLKVFLVKGFMILLFNRNKKSARRL